MHRDKSYRNYVITVAEGFHLTAQGKIANPPRCTVMRVLFLVVNNAETDDEIWFWDTDAFPFSVNEEIIPLFSILQAVHTYIRQCHAVSNNTRILYYYLLNAELCSMLVNCIVIKVDIIIVIILFFISYNLKIVSNFVLVIRIYC